MNATWAIDLLDRETCEVAVSDYASGFESYDEARDFGRRYEMEFRSCGWTYAVRRTDR